VFPLSKDRAKSTSVATADRSREKKIRLFVDIHLDEVLPTPATSEENLAPEAPIAPPALPPAPLQKGLLRRNLSLLIVLGGLAVITLAGWEYYKLPAALRVRHDYHPWLKPSGYIGQSAGVLAFLMFLFMYLYPLRKRLRSWARLGSLPRWLNVHIACGLVVPLVGAIHAGWRFQGVIGIGYAAMLLVSLSGIVGKYIYVHIPRSRAGVELSMAELEQRGAQLIDEIARKAGLDPAEVEQATASVSDRRGTRGLLATLGNLLAGDLMRFVSVHRLRRRWAGQGSLDKQALREVLGLARRQIRLTQQRRMLEATQRVFRFWHVIHQPFSITAFAAVMIHVAAVVGMGVTWFW
jgi:hypothetical protein